MWIFDNLNYMLLFVKYNTKFLKQDSSRYFYLLEYSPPLYDVVILICFPQFFFSTPNLKDFKSI